LLFGRRLGRRWPLDALLVQDWVTLSAATGITSITQGADRWLEVPTVADAVFFLDVKQPGTGIGILYQTSPRREDSSFFTMLSVPITSTTTTVYGAVLAAYATVPMAKYVRWQLTFSGASSITFRLWMATYSLG
jgi:hypothetical protein